MLKCRELSGLVATDEVEKVGWMKKLEIRMHLMMCGHCRRYVEQIRALGIGARSLIRGSEANRDQIDRMEQDVIDRVCNHGSGGHHDPGPQET